MYSSGWSVWRVDLRLDYRLQNCGPVTSRKIEAGENRGRCAVTMHVAPDAHSCDDAEVHRLQNQ